MYDHFYMIKKNACAGLIYLNMKPKFEMVVKVITRVGETAAFSTASRRRAFIDFSSEADPDLVDIVQKISKP